MNIYIYVIFLLHRALQIQYNHAAASNAPSNLKTTPPGPASQPAASVYQKSREQRGVQDKKYTSATNNARTLPDPRFLRNKVMDSHIFRTWLTCFVVCLSCRSFHFI